MKLSISNIAWEAEQEQCVFEILHRANVNVIDVAPTKYVDNVAIVSDDELRAIRQHIRSAGFSMEGMQSLLFGTTGLNIFDSDEVQNTILTHLDYVCRIGDRLGARKLVFGSPRNRDRSRLDDEQVLPHAKQFFTRLGDVAQKHNVLICLEPNPACYNANFMTNSFETAEVVEAIGHPYIKMQLDVGAMQINNEDVEEVFSSCHQFVGHIHISQPQLAPVNSNADYHKAVAEVLNRYLPELPICIEMLTKGDDGERLRKIEESIQFVQTIYGKHV